ncbi:MAG: hypothetical protein RXQ94_06670 [Caldivirga sp.]
MVNPLGEYYEGVKGLIRGKCGGDVVLVLSPPLTQADKLVDELSTGRYSALEAFINHCINIITDDKHKWQTSP